MAAREETKTQMMISLRRLVRGSKIAEEVAEEVEVAVANAVIEEAEVIVVVEIEVDHKLLSQVETVMLLQWLLQEAPQNKSEHFEMSDLKAINL